MQARTREDILLAAARCLARGGFNAVSMQEIATEVGFTAPALYAYFESREAIFEELFLSIRRELIAIFEPARGPRRGAGTGPRPFSRRLGELIRRQLEWMDGRRDVFLAVMALKMRAEAWASRPSRKDCSEPMPMLHLRLLAEWLTIESTVADRGGFDAGEAASFLLGTMQGFIWRWLRDPGADRRLADETDRILALFLHGLLGARTSPGDS